jgi:hypothetical protein
MKKITKIKGTYWINTKGFTLKSKLIIAWWIITEQTFRLKDVKRAEFFGVKTFPKQKFYYRIK